MSSHGLLSATFEGRTSPQTRRGMNPTMCKSAFTGCRSEFRLDGYYLVMSTMSIGDEPRLVRKRGLGCRNEAAVEASR